MTSARLSSRAKSFYSAGLRPGEAVLRSFHGYAARTGTLIGSGVLLGGVIGLLYAIYLDAAHLPAIVLGALGGIVGGYFYAEHVARRPTGPGRTSFTVLTTTQRLIILRKHNPIRPRALRTYALDSITGVMTRRYPFANYHYTTIETTSGSTTNLIIDGKLEIDPVNTAPATG